MISRLVAASVAVVPVRRSPSEQAEMVTQLLLGETARVRSAPDPLWLEVEVALDGYRGYVSENMVTACPDWWPPEHAPEAGRAYRLRSRIAQVDVEGERWLLPMGVRLLREDAQTLRLPDGRVGRFQGGLPELIPEGLPASGAEAPGLLMMQIAEELLGVPYLWAGRSAFGIDCSGLVQLTGLLCGLRLPRDADQQSTEGVEVDPSWEALQPGDLLFFVYPWGEGEIDHVAFYGADRRILHASGCVRWNSFNQQDSNFSKKHLDTLVGARRLPRVPASTEEQLSNR